jgi:hypothetical protein
MDILLNHVLINRSNHWFHFQADLVWRDDPFKRAHWSTLNRRFTYKKNDGRKKQLWTSKETKIYKKLDRK